MRKEHREVICETLASVGRINPKSGVAYAVSYFSKFTRIGIGISRREITRSTGRLSPFIHSWSTFHRYLGIAKDFAIFCKSEKANKLHKITYSIIEKFILGKIEKGRTRNTIESNICALLKFFRVCGRADLDERLSRDYAGYKYLAREGQRIYSFDKPTELIITIGRRDELAGVVAQIVRTTGVRIHELRPLVMEGASALIKKGKGGKERTVDFMYQAEDIAKLESLLARFRDMSHAGLQGEMRLRTYLQKNPVGRVHGVLQRTDRQTSWNRHFSRQADTRQWKPTYHGWQLKGGTYG